MYKGIAIAVLLVAGLSPARAETEVTVVVSGILENTGSVMLAVFDNDKDWLKRPVASVEAELDAEAEPGPVELTLLLPAGSYAFNVYHDVDGNGEMKTNFIGIPKEPTGVSNDAKGKFGPPKFKDAVLEISDDNATVEINLVEI